MNWRWAAAALFFLSALVALLMGVSLSERPEVTEAGLLTKAYYSLGLFVVGGLDVGIPTGGPAIGRLMLWVAYFGAPLLMASAVIEAVLRVMRPQRWQLRRLKNHIVIVGSGELTTSYLRMLRGHVAKTPIVVIDETIDPLREKELEQTFDVTVVAGDISHEFLQRELQLDRASQVVFLGDNDFQAYETANKVLRQFPELDSKIILHCHNLRFMRSMQDTSVAKLCTTFNSYHLAARSLVDQAMLRHFQSTENRDLVVIAGFGRFGQTILEQLEANAESELDQVVVIDIDADRRVLVAEEQQLMKGDYQKLVLQGDISHPDVWRKLVSSVDLEANHPTIILGTGRAEENMRTSLWIKRKYPNALVFARTNDISELALEIGAEHNIQAFSIKQLVEDNLPNSWLPETIQS